VSKRTGEDYPRTSHIALRSTGYSTFQELPSLAQFEDPQGGQAMPGQFASPMHPDLLKCATLSAGMATGLALGPVRRLETYVRWASVISRLRRGRRLPAPEYRPGPVFGLNDIRVCQLWAPLLPGNENEGLCRSVHNALRD